MNRCKLLRRIRSAILVDFRVDADEIRDFLRFYNPLAFSEGARTCKDLQRPAKMHGGSSFLFSVEEKDLFSGPFPSILPSK